MDENATVAARPKADAEAKAEGGNSERNVRESGFSDVIKFRESVKNFLSKDGQAPSSDIYAITSKIKSEPKLLDAVLDATKESIEEALGDKGTLQNINTRVMAVFFAQSSIWSNDPRSEQHDAKQAQLFFKPATASTLMLAEKGRFGKTYTLEDEFRALQELYNADPEHVARPYFMTYDENGRPSGYFVQCVRGMSLSDILEGKAEMPKDAEQQIIDFVRRLQEKGLMHGDLHYGNIMFTDEGKLMVVDPLGLTSSAGEAVRRKAWDYDRMRAREAVKEIWDSRKYTHPEELEIYEPTKEDARNGIRTHWQKYLSQKGIGDWPKSVAAEPQ